VINLKIIFFWVGRGGVIAARRRAFSVGGTDLTCRMTAARVILQVEHSGWINQGGGACVS
ncbi:hypothetical protein, partial [Kribbella sp. NPDC006257]|uniref:hypothetical protein n=1 Tax=Kribbella sp. NPDC006257 TaxID=3156738 RepID=UPI0033AB3F08